MCSMGWTVKQINGMVFSVFPFPLHAEFSIIVFFLVVLSLRVSARVLASASSLFLFLHFTITTLTCEHHFPFPIFQSLALHSQKNVYTNLHCTYIRCDFVARNPFFIAAYATMPELFTCKTYLYSIWSKTNKQKMGEMSVSLYPFCWWFFLFLLLCHFFGSIQLFWKNRMRGRNVWMKVRHVNFHLSVRAVAFTI